MCLYFCLLLPISEASIRVRCTSWCVCVCVTCLSSPPLITYHTCGNGLPKEKLNWKQGWRDINGAQVQVYLYAHVDKRALLQCNSVCVRVCVSSRISYSKTLHSLKSVKHFFFFYFVTVWKWGVIEPKMTTNLFWSTENWERAQDLIWWPTSNVLLLHPSFYNPLLLLHVCMTKDWIQLGFKV